MLDSRRKDCSKSLEETRYRDPGKALFMGRFAVDIIATVAGHDRHCLRRPEAKFGRRPFLAALRSCDGGLRFEEGRQLDSICQVNVTLSRCRGDQKRRRRELESASHCPGI
jgi:hypothetical protein